MFKNYEIVYEEEEFMIINKSSGLLTHKNQYSANENNLIDLLKNNKKNYYLIHRIDKYTSGLLIVAKSKISVLKFQELFHKSQIHKEYLAITERELPAKEIKINLSLGRSKSDKLMFTNKNAKNYKQACTHIYKINKQLIKAVLKTGKTHQIRAHLFSIKYPIVNDPIYGTSIPNDNFGQYLHAYQLSFINPFDKKNMTFTLRPPQQFIDKLHQLNISIDFLTKIKINDNEVIPKNFLNPHINVTFWHEIKISKLNLELKIN